MLKEKPSKEKFLPKYDPWGRYNGIEIEFDKDSAFDRCCDRGTGPRIYTGVWDGSAVKAIFPNADIKEDSTVSNGMEVNLPPMTYGYAVSRAPFSALMAKMRELGYQEDSRSCGIHIHVSKRGVARTPEKYKDFALNMAQFFNKFWNPLSEGPLYVLSRRGFQGNDGTKWCKHSEHMRSAADDKDQLWCTITDHLNYHDSQAIRHLGYFGRVLAEGQPRYAARDRTLEEFYALPEGIVNDSPATGGDSSTGNTVEFRIYRSTVTYSRLISYIQLSNEIVNVCKAYSWDEMCALKWPEFVERCKHYRQLNSYMIERGVAYESLPTEAPTMQVDAQTTLAGVV